MSISPLIAGEEKLPRVELDYVQDSVLNLVTACAGWIGEYGDFDACFLL